MLSRVKRINQQKLSQKAWRVYKHGYQRLVLPQPTEKQIAFILGCQRSGTTLMVDIFDKDRNAKVYPEYSKLSSLDPDGLRLDPLPQVEAIFNRDKAPLIVAKPLVETQNALRLLEFFPGAKIIWMYRHYQDVAISKLKKSGLYNGVRDMQYIVEQRDHWRGEMVPDHVREMIASFYSSDMNPYDGAALYWYVRNVFFFEYGLDANPNVYLCKYEDFVRHPRAYIEDIYTFLNRPLPTDDIVSGVYSSSVGKGRGIEITEGVRMVCDEMLSRLDTVYETSTKLTTIPSA